MQVTFTPEEELQLDHLAAQKGIAVEDMVRAAVLDDLERGALYRSAVEQGIACAERGETISDDEMWARIDRILNR